MFASRWFDVAIIIGFFYLLGPLVVRSTFRFSADCKPVRVSREELPQAIAAIFRERIPQIQNLGFEFVGCYDCGGLASNTQSYIAYFCKRMTGFCECIGGSFPEEERQLF